MLNYQYYEGTCPQRKSASILKIGYPGLLMTTAMSFWELRRKIHREFCQIIFMLHVFQEKKKHLSIIESVETSTNMVNQKIRYHTYQTHLVTPFIAAPNLASGSGINALFHVRLSARKNSQDQRNVCRTPVVRRFQE